MIFLSKNHQFSYLVRGQSTVASRTALLQVVNKKHCEGCDSRLPSDNNELELVSSPLPTTSSLSNARSLCRFRTTSDGPSIIRSYIIIIKDKNSLSYKKRKVLM